MARPEGDGVCVVGAGDDGSVEVAVVGGFVIGGASDVPCSVVVQLMRPYTSHSVSSGCRYTEDGQEVMKMRD